MGSRERRQDTGTQAQDHGWRGLRDGVTPGVGPRALALGARALVGDRTRRRRRAGTGDRIRRPRRRHPSPHALGISLAWQQVLPDAGDPIAESSPNVATLDGGGTSVVVGDRAGSVYAFHLSNGSGVPRLARHLGAPVDSTPVGQPRRLRAPTSSTSGTGNAAEPDRRRLRRASPTRARRSGPGRPPTPTATTESRRHWPSGRLRGGPVRGGTVARSGRLRTQRRQRRRAPGLAVLHGRQRIHHAVAGRPLRQRQNRDRRGRGLDGRQRQWRAVPRNGGHLRVLGYRREPDLRLRHRPDRRLVDRPSGNFLGGRRCGHRLRYRHLLPGRLGHQQALRRRRQLQHRVAGRPRAATPSPARPSATCSETAPSRCRRSRHRHRADWCGPSTGRTGRPARLAGVHPGPDHRRRHHSPTSPAAATTTSSSRPPRASRSSTASPPSSWPPSATVQSPCRTRPW